MNRSILIVEDDGQYLALYSKILAELDCEITAIQNVKAALSLLLRREFAVILVDLKIPGTRGTEMGGLELVHGIRELGLLSEILVVTAFGTLERALEVGRYGVSAFIEKPIDVAEVRTVVSKAMRAYDQQTQLVPRRTKLDPLSRIEAVFDVFTECAGRMANRGHRRPPFSIEGEYDVQDLLFIMLKPAFPDLICEKVLPEHGGRSKRVDFAIPSVRACIEAKLVRSRDHAAKLGDEIKIDIESYHVGDAFKVLYFFIFDPELFLRDRHNLSRDLSGPRTVDGRSVESRVLIRPV